MSSDVYKRLLETAPVPASVQRHVASLPIGALHLAKNPHLTDEAWDLLWDRHVTNTTRHHDLGVALVNWELKPARQARVLDYLFAQHHYTETIDVTRYFLDVHTLTTVQLAAITAETLSSNVVIDRLVARYWRDADVLDAIYTNTTSARTRLALAILPDDAPALAWRAALPTFTWPETFTDGPRRTSLRSTKPLRRSVQAALDLLGDDLDRWLLYAEFAETRLANYPEHQGRDPLTTALRLAALG
jgi:hypothetical protein